MLLHTLQQEAEDWATPPERLCQLARHDHLAEILASNVLTPAALLKSLSHHARPGVCQAVAANPNTPLDVLAQLAEIYPTIVALNVVWPLLLVSDPAAVRSLSAGAQELILRHEQTPAGLVKSLLCYGHEDLREEASLHVALGGEANASWHEESLCHIAATLTLDGVDDDLWRLPGLFSSEALAWLARFPRLKPALAWCPNASPEHLADLADHPDAKVRLAVAGHPNTPLATLRTIARHAPFEERCAVARNPNTPPDTIDRLVHDPDHLLRRAIAGHPYLNEAHIAALAHDVIPVRRVIAGHKHLPVGWLEEMSRDCDAVVRWHVASHHDCPEVVLAQLARDSVPYVRATVARHPALTRMIFDRMASDAHPLIQFTLTASAFVTYDHLEYLLETTEPALRTQAAANPRLPVARLEQIAAQVQAAMTAGQTTPLMMALARGLALNPVSPSELLMSLARLPDKDVCLALARHPHTPSVALQQLAQREEREIRQAIARHAQTPLTTLIWLMAQGNLALCRQIVVHPLVTDQLRQHLYEVLFATLLQQAPIPHANGQATFLRFLKEIAGIAASDRHLVSRGWRSRFFAALAQGAYHRAEGELFPALMAPNETVQNLARDGNRFVRAAARSRLAQPERAT